MCESSREIHGYMTMPTNLLMAAVLKVMKESSANEMSDKVQKVS